MSNSLQPHELQQTRLPCPSLSASVCSNSCPLSQWYHPTILLLPINLHSILKTSDISSPTKIQIVKAMVFPVVMYVWMWEVDHKEGWRIDAFELWCWRRLLRVPWIVRRSNSSILKAISPEYSLEGLMLKLKLQYAGHLMQRADSFEKTLMVGKVEGRRRKGRQRMRWLVGITDTMVMSLSRLRELLIDREACVLQSMGLQRVGHDWATELNWTDLLIWSIQE